MSSNDKNAELKDQYIEYYAEAPIQKYAAMYIGKDETTIIRWKEADADFANRVDQARAKWVSSKLKKANVEFALERLESEVFGRAEKETAMNVLQLIINKYGGSVEGVINEVPRPEAIEGGSPQDIT